MDGRLSVRLGRVAEDTQVHEADLRVNVRLMDVDISGLAQSVEFAGIVEHIRLEVGEVLAGKSASYVLDIEISDGLDYWMMVDDGGVMYLAQGSRRNPDTYGSHEYGAVRNIMDRWHRKIMELVGEEVAKRIQSD